MTDLAKQNDTAGRNHGEPKLTDADKPRFAAAIGSLGVALNRQVDKELLRVYWRALQYDLTIDEVETAATAALREARFFPTVAELRDGAGRNVAAQANVRRITQRHIARQQFLERERQRLGLTGPERDEPKRLTDGGAS